MALKSISFLCIGLVCFFFSSLKETKRTYIQEKISGGENIIKKAEEKPLGYLNLLPLQKSYPFYNLNSSLNDVSKNVEWIKSNLPDVKNGNFILAAHSGNADISYFQNLRFLKVGDIVSVLMKEHEYFYEVIDTYEILKKNTLIERPMDETVLTLVTCVTLTNRRFIVIAKQIEYP